MFRHVALFTWKPEATDAQRLALAEQLRKLPGVIGTIRGYHLGPDAGVNTGNADFAVVAEFDDEAGYLEYRDHPEHRRIITEYLRPILASRLGVQFES
jgi:Stress responsive A/B Barrel Domain